MRDTQIRKSVEISVYSSRPNSNDARADFAVKGDRYVTVTRSDEDHVDYVPIEDLQAQKAETDDPLQQSLSALILDYAKGDAIDMTNTLKTFPVQLTSVKDYASRVMAKTGVAETAKKY